MDELVWSPPDHEDGYRRRFSQVLGINGSLRRWIALVEKGQKVSPFQWLNRCPGAGETIEGRQQVDERHELTHPLRIQTRGLDDQGNAEGLFKEMLLEPHAPLTQHFAVVGREHNRGVLSGSGGFKSVQYS